MKNVCVWAISAVIFLTFSCQQNSPPAPGPNPQAVDTIPPVITITGGNSQSQMAPQVPGNGTWTNPTATAIDNVDGNISASITVTGMVDPNTVGFDTLYYSVSDVAGNSNTDTLIVQITPYAVAHVAPYLGGNYLVSDTCTVTGAYQFPSSWTCSGTINDKVTINNFGAFGAGVDVDCTVDTCTQTLSFATPIVLGSVQPTSTLTAASAYYTYNGNSVHVVMNWTFTDGTSSESCVSHYVK